ncbi:uncharacterized protein MICAL-like isoform X2 [Epargyreus clarus]|uniref:uncharacterized protein MICAL-like isoform X2 n=1 Tax=Epargyreus clarus TaxID=520877 RepID=UPI003C2D9058
MSEIKGTKALELWCKRLVKDCPDVQIDNMSTSWRNGMAFCALVHHFRPDLIDLSKLKPENIYENNLLAYSIAEKHLGIPALLDPEDMVDNDVPDRLSVLTYLSQFYQRLGHTVNTKVSDNESKVAASSASVQSTTPIKFGKVGLDKCTACGLPVYLAQRLIVSQKLYHRRCFRCSKCEGHLNPKNFKTDEVSEFICDTCKNEKDIPKFNNNDQVGMLAFNSDVCDRSPTQKEEPVNLKQKYRPLSILEKISMFEKNIEKETNMEEKIGNISLNNSVSNSNLHVNENHSTSKPLNESMNTESMDREQETIEKHNFIPEVEPNLYNKQIPETTYKSNIEKLNFLQTQLSGDVVAIDVPLDKQIVNIEKQFTEAPLPEEFHASPVTEISIPKDLINEESNITDDSRLAQNNSVNLDTTFSVDTSNSVQNEQEITISVPPRRKKNLSPGDKKTKILDKVVTPKKDIEYPDHLNPFSDTEDDTTVNENKEPQRRVSTNPFGSSDEDEDVVPPIQPIPKLADNQTLTPVKRHIKACNPFWSDGEEPSSDEEEPSSRSSSMYKSSLAASTPNLPASTPRRRKPRAPPPPAARLDAPATSMDDVASISSLSSHTSTVHSDQKSFGISTPKLKKRLAPTPPDSLSTLSGYEGSLEKGIDTSGIRHNVSDGASGGRRAKGPAPGLPLPARREVRLQLPPEQLQVQLDLLETQQLGLERQGVLIEQMIRDKCDEANTVPQEEVEDLVIQLCELVNEKNDLFRKQTELMYIRRQQRLEQEQADIEHEIRVIQSQPAVNRIDADKAREEQLVSRLVAIVRLRDELVQQLDAERRRERQEDLAIAASIASKRAQRNSDSNSSSMKSAEAVTPGKKTKVKDKVKKQLKKAKHTLISKKKDEDKEKEKKPK